MKEVVIYINDGKFCEMILYMSGVQWVMPRWGGRYALLLEGTFWQALSCRHMECHSFMRYAVYLESTAHSFIFVRKQL